MKILLGDFNAKERREDIFKSTLVTVVPTATIFPTTLSRLPLGTFTLLQFETINTFVLKSHPVYSLKEFIGQHNSTHVE
jgi:hypothetical protein